MKNGERPTEQIEGVLRIVGHGSEQSWGKRVNASRGIRRVLSAHGGGEAGVIEILFAFDMGDAVYSGGRRDRREISLSIAVLTRIGEIVRIAQVVAVVAGISSLNQVANIVVVVEA